MSKMKKKEMTNVGREKWDNYSLLVGFGFGHNIIQMVLYGRFLCDKTFFLGGKPIKTQDVQEGGKIFCPARKLCDLW